MRSLFWRHFLFWNWSLRSLTGALFRVCVWRRRCAELCIRGACVHVLCPCLWQMYLCAVLYISCALVQLDRQIKSLTSNARICTLSSCVFTSWMNNWCPHLLAFNICIFLLASFKPFPIVSCWGGGGPSGCTLLSRYCRQTPHQQSMESLPRADCVKVGDWHWLGCSSIPRQDKLVLATASCRYYSIGFSRCPSWVLVWSCTFGWIQEFDQIKGQRFLYKDSYCLSCE